MYDPNETSVDPIPPGAIDRDSRPYEFKMKIEGGVLDNLGIKMYTRVGKVLVEFAANAFDSDSPFVDIRFDATTIAWARDEVRREATKKLEAERLDEAPPADSRRPKRRAHVIVDPLPEDVTITIRDTGHGMSASQIAEAFLPLNRNRRRRKGAQEESDFYSEAGKRLVMGRKGIGKLSAFGVAERMKVRSKRAGQTFWTEVDLRADTLRMTTDIGSVVIPHEYHEALPHEVDHHGTTITLMGLRCDSMNFTGDEIESVLAETFNPIRPEEFEIRLQGDPIRQPKPELEFVYPEGMADGGMAEETLDDPHWGALDLRYRVQFRKKSLPAEKRGAYIYSKNRLAMDPSLLGLNTGMHNFMAQQYMECIVESDDLDNLNVDVIGTNRAGIIQSSDVVKSFLRRVTDIMREAVNAHARFKEREADRMIDTAPEARELRRVLTMIAPNQQRHARDLAKVFVGRYGVHSDEFEHLTPLIIGTANAGEILIDLIRVSGNAESIAEIAPKLVELREVERDDAIKLYQARRNGIIGLERVVDGSMKTIGKGPHDERALHQLLKASPWLIRPDLSGYIASDEGMANVLDRLAAELKVDGYAPPPAENASIAPEGETEDQEQRRTVRPDLVALVGDGPHPANVFVVELKAPTVPLRVEHLTQLKTYMTRVRRFFEAEGTANGRKVKVEGALIGALPHPSTKSDGQMQLLAELGDRGPNADWEVLSLHEMLARTRRVHEEMLGVLKRRADEEAASSRDSVEGGQATTASATAGGSGETA
ncbi:ATP-binding protein [Aureimonas sp. AU22]|uniref:ATP-binding protein n=1 Tax=Aureimonas sp. AU22 TaxID=1638162 RepID=UPI000780CD0F|nr:ATP-binding protein [Aureimonas sp. AU22]